MSGYGILRAMLYVFFRLYNRIRVTEAEKVPDRGGVIVAANHISYIDPLVLAVSMRRRATFMAKDELFRMPFLRFLVRAAALPVKRSRPGPSSIREAIKELGRGGLIVIFPEGGIPDGRKSGVKKGVGMLARLSGAKVVPALIEGAGRALPVGAWFVRPAKVAVRFGDPVEPGRDDEKTAMAVMDGIERLAPEDGAGP